MVRCAICYHLYNFENVKNTHAGVLILVLKVTLLHRCFLCFLNGANGTKSRNASQSIGSTVLEWYNVRSINIRPLESVVFCYDKELLQD